MEILHNYFAEICTLVSIGVWLLRLEGKILSVEKVSDAAQSEIKSLDTKLNEFDSKLLEKLSEIAERLSFIEGSLKGMSPRGKK